MGRQKQRLQLITRNKLDSETASPIPPPQKKVLFVAPPAENNNINFYKPRNSSASFNGSRSIEETIDSETIDTLRGALDTSNQSNGFLTKNLKLTRIGYEKCLKKLENTVDALAREREFTEYLTNRMKRNGFTQITSPESKWASVSLY